MLSSIILEKLKVRCSDENGFDVPDSPMIARDVTPSAPPSAPQLQNAHPGTIFACTVELNL